MPKKKRIAPAPQFTFVNWGKEEASFGKEARSHVMRQYMQQKRRERDERLARLPLQVREQDGSETSQHVDYSSEVLDVGESSLNASATNDDRASARKPSELTQGEIEEPHLPTSITSTAPTVVDSDSGNPHTSVRQGKKPQTAAHRQPGPQPIFQPHLPLRPLQRELPAWDYISGHSEDDVQGGLAQSFLSPPLVDLTSTAIEGEREAPWLAESLPISVPDTFKSPASNFKFPRQLVRFHDPPRPSSTLFTSPYMTPSPPSPESEACPSLSSSRSSSRSHSSSFSSATGPMDLLSSLRRDAFNSYPVRLSEQDHKLVDYWLEKFPTMIHLDADPRVESRFSPTRKVFFPAAMSSPWAFETTVLLFAALSFAKALGLTDTQQTSLHRARALRLTKEHIQSLSARAVSIEGDSDMVAFLSLAVSENRYGDKLQSLAHLQAVRQYLRRRREKNQLPLDRKADMIFQWYNMIITEDTYYSANINPQIRAELISDTKALWTFCSTARALALQQSLPQGQQDMPRRTHAFRRGTLLHRVMTCVPESRNDRFYQLTILLYLHAALIDHKDAHEQSENFLKILALKVIEMELDYSTHPLHPFLWIVLTDPVLYSPRRTAALARLKQPLRRLGHLRMATLCETLIAYLVLDVGNDGLVSLPVIDEEDFESEIFTFDSWQYLLDAPGQYEEWSFG